MSGGDWWRVSGELVPDDCMEAKRHMLDAYPSLRKMYDENDDNTIVLYFKNATARFCSMQVGKARRDRGVLATFDVLKCARSRTIELGGSMSSKGSDPMEVFVGLRFALVAAVVLGVEFQVCEAMGPVARAIACACGVAVMVALPFPRPRARSLATTCDSTAAQEHSGGAVRDACGSLVALGMGGNLNGGSAAVMVLVPEVAFLASLGNRPGT